MLVIVRVNGHLKFLRVVVVAVASSAGVENPVSKTHTNLHVVQCCAANHSRDQRLTHSLTHSPYLMHKDTLSKLIIGDELVCSLCSMCCYWQF